MKNTTLQLEGTQEPNITCPYPNAGMCVDSNNLPLLVVMKIDEGDLIHTQADVLCLTPDGNVELAEITVKHTDLNPPDLNITSGKIIKGNPLELFFSERLLVFIETNDYTEDTFKFPDFLTAKDLTGECYIKHALNHSYSREFYIQFDQPDN